MAAARSPPSRCAPCSASPTARRIVDLFEHLMKGDAAAALTEFRAQYDVGADPAAVLTDLAEFSHLVTRLRFVPSAADDASLSEDERRRGAEFAEALSVRVLSRTWQMLLKGIPEVQASNRPVSAAEMVLIRIAHAADLPTLDEALKALGDAPRSAGAARPADPRRRRNDRATALSAVAAGRVPASQGGGQTMRLVETPPPRRPRSGGCAAAAGGRRPPCRSDRWRTSPRLPRPIATWLFKAQLKSYVRLVRVEPGRLDVGLTGDAPKTLAGDLKARLESWTGRRWMVVLSREEGGRTLAEKEAARRESAILDARNDPAVAAILARFPGAKIIDVRIPDAADGDGRRSRPAAAKRRPDDDETDF